MIVDVDVVLVDLSQSVAMFELRFFGFGIINSSGHRQVVHQSGKLSTDTN